MWHRTGTAPRPLFARAIRGLAAHRALLFGPGRSRASRVAVKATSDPQHGGAAQQPAALLSLHQQLSVYNTEAEVLARKADLAYNKLVQAYATGGTTTAQKGLIKVHQTHYDNLLKEKERIDSMRRELLTLLAQAVASDTPTSGGQRSRSPSTVAFFDTAADGQGAPGSSLVPGLDSELYGLALDEPESAVPETEQEGAATEQEAATADDTASAKSAAAKHYSPASKTPGRRAKSSKSVSAPATDRRKLFPSSPAHRLPWTVMQARQLKTLSEGGTFTVVSLDDPAAAPITLDIPPSVQVDIQGLEDLSPELFKPGMHIIPRDRSFPVADSLLLIPYSSLLPRLRNKVVRPSTPIRKARGQVQALLAENSQISPTPVWPEQCKGVTPDDDVLILLVQCTTSSLHPVSIRGLYELFHRLPKNTYLFGLVHALPTGTYEEFQVQEHKENKGYCVPIVTRQFKTLIDVAVEVGEESE